VLRRAEAAEEAEEGADQLHWEVAREARKEVREQVLKLGEGEGEEAAAASYAHR
jgi:hypothetical protein